VQKQIKEKKKRKKKEKKIYRGGFQTASIDHFQKWILKKKKNLSIEAVINCLNR
jgi:hypothetical protein